MADDLSPQDRDLITRTILSEAGKEGDTGMAGVAAVIRNRLQSGEFGDSASNVVLQPNAFEPWSLPRSDPNHPSRWSTRNPDYQHAASIVDSVWSGKSKDPTGGATYFLNPTLQAALGRKQPDWASGTPSARIGGHVFYADDDTALISKYSKGPTAPIQQGTPAAPMGDEDLLAKYSKAAPAPNISAGSDVTDTASAAAGGFTRGIPIIGPYLDEGAQRVAAGIRSAVHGTAYNDELKAVKSYVTQTTQQHPYAETAGEIGGSVYGVGAAALAAPEAFGLGTGPLLGRTLASGTTGATINAADVAARGGDPTQAALGGVIGGGFGLAGPVAGRAIGAVTNKAMGLGSSAYDTATTYLAQRAQELRIPIRPPQMSVSPFVRKLDQMVGQLPGGGGMAAAADQHGAITRAVSRTFGEDTDSITPQVMRGAKSRIGEAFNTIQNQMIVKPDDALVNRIGSVVDDAKRFLGENEGKIIEAHADRIASKFEANGEMPGASYRSLTKTKSPLDNAVKKGGDIGFYAGELRDALDEAAQRSSPPELSTALSNAKLQYKNMKTIEPLVVKGEPGEINALALQNRVNASYRNRAYSGAGELGDIADIAQRFMRQPRDSGTPQGNYIMQLLGAHAPRVGSALLGGGLGAGAYYSGQSPLESAGIALGGLGGTALTARTLRAVLNNPALLSGLLQRATAVPRITVTPAMSALQPYSP